MVENTREEIALSSAYDGRLQYHKILGTLMASKAFATIQDDLYTVERCLREMVIITNPYVKKPDYAEMMQRLEKAKRLLDTGNNALRPAASKHLSWVNSTWHNKAAHLLLPISKDQDEYELTDEMMEQFFRESDLTTK